MNYKIRVINPEHSKEIQELLFALGYSWTFEGREFCNLNQIFLYTDHNMRIDFSHRANAIFFEKHKYKEVTLEDLKQLLKDKTMNKKITEQEVNIIKELCEVKGVYFASEKISLNIFPFLSKIKGGDFYLTNHITNAISFDEALNFLADIKTKEKIVKLNDEYSAEILEDKVKVGCQEFTFDTIERLYKALKE